MKFHLAAPLNFRRGLSNGGDGVHNEGVFKPREDEEAFLKGFLARQVDYRDVVEAINRLEGMTPEHARELSEYYRGKRHALLGKGKERISF